MTFNHPLTKRWLFFLGVTLALTLPLAVAYFYLGDLLTQRECQRHQGQINARLNIMQAQLYDAKWDALADTYDDTLHLGRCEEAKLLRDTLRWYAYPDGRSFVEGIAVVNPDGGLRPSRLAAVIGDDGRPLPAERLAELKKRTPWLEDPWLPSYAFVAKAFSDDPKLENWQSPLIEAPGRLVFVVASAKRDSRGNLSAAVILQHSVDRLWRDQLAPASRGLDLWLVDGQGTQALATSQLAGASLKRFVNAGLLAKVLAGGSQAADKGQLGAAGRLGQTLDGEKLILNYRSQNGDMVLGVASRESDLGAQGASALGYLGVISLWSLFMLAAAGAIYTMAALRDEARTVEKRTLQRYAGTVSHRVRNDLATVLGNLELISRGRLTDLEAIKQNLDGTVAEALADVQATVEELERLSRGEVELARDGQLGSGTMYDIAASGAGGAKQ
ncbi:hypothetical protein AAU61_18175 [Desulfocarbo indianensis]|nr:hypothetical protein AAU61_18175 [Desulfocarbo indianensis]